MKCRPGVRANAFFFARVCSGIACWRAAHGRRCRGNYCCRALATAPFHAVHMTLPPLYLLHARFSQSPNEGSSTPSALCPYRSKIGKIGDADTNPPPTLPPAISCFLLRLLIRLSLLVVTCALRGALKKTVRTPREGDTTLTSAILTIGGWRAFFPKWRWLSPGLTSRINSSGQSGLGARGLASYGGSCAGE